MRYSSKISIVAMLALLSACDGGSTSGGGVVVPPSPAPSPAPSPSPTPAPTPTPAPIFYRTLDDNGADRSFTMDQVFDYRFELNSAKPSTLLSSINSANFGRSLSTYENDRRFFFNDGGSASYLFSSDMLVPGNSDYRIYFDDKAGRVAGWRPKTLQTRYVSPFYIYQGSRGLVVIAGYMMATADKLAGGSTYSSIARIHRPLGDGSVKAYSTTVAMIVTDAGGISGAVTFPASDGLPELKLELSGEYHGRAFDGTVVDAGRTTTGMFRGYFYGPGGPELAIGFHLGKSTETIGIGDIVGVSPR